LECNEQEEASSNQEGRYHIQASNLVAPDESCPMIHQMRQAHPSSSHHQTGLLACSAS
jgi:hypothetical protein